MSPGEEPAGNSIRDCNMELDEPISGPPSEDATATSGGESETDTISDPNDHGSSSEDESSEADNDELQPDEDLVFAEHSTDHNAESDAEDNALQPDKSSTNQNEESDAEDDALQPEAKLYFVRGNAMKKHRVTRYREVKGKIPLWKHLLRQDSCDLQGTLLFVGDLVQVSTQARDPEAIAQIAEIRDLPDGRHVLRIFWWLKKHQLRGRLAEEDYGTLPKPPLYIKTNHTQVILWDTVERLRLDVEEKKLPGMILCYTPNGAKLYREDHPQTRWTRVEKARGKNQGGNENRDGA